jgi:uncharacterized protein
MRNLILIIFVLGGIKHIHGQEILKENLSKPVVVYWDFEKIKILSEGCYFVDFRGPSAEKHGVWKYYDKNGNLEEVHNYYRNKLHGAVWQYHGKDKPKTEGYFKMGLQDSIFRAWHENDTLILEGRYNNDKPFHYWNYFYPTGDTMMVEQYRDTVPLVMSYYEKNGEQTVKNGNGTMQTLYSNGKPKDIYTFTNGLKNGPFTEYHVAGHAEVTGSYNNGLKSGTWTHRYYTGQLHKIVTYEQGVMNGTYINYYDNEQVRVAGKYLNGFKDSTWTWYTNTGVVDMTGDFIEDIQHGDWVYNFPNGQCSYKGQYIMGKMNGVWVYYYQDGSRHRQGNYKDDVEDGRWQTWYESGKLLMDGVYAMGKENGLWLNYWENGKIKNSGHFKNGVLHGKWESYFPNGIMNISGEYKNGLKSGPWVDYYSNGKARELVTYKVIKVKSKLNKTSYQESVRNGKYEAYSSKDFKLTEEGTFKNGKKHGLWIAYHPGGRLPAVTSEYKDGKLHGFVREYDFKAGKLLRSETQYKDGVKHGKMTIYDKRGKKVAEKFFDNGVEVKQNDFTPPPPRKKKKK